MWNCGRSSADALELLQSYAGSSVWVYKLFYTFISMVILMTWRGTVEAPVLTHWSCCRLVLGHKCEYISCSIHLLPRSYWWLGMECTGTGDNNCVPTHREPPYSRYANICHLLIVLNKTHCLLLHVPHCNASVLLLLISVWWTNMVYVKYVIEEYSLH